MPRTCSRGGRPSPPPCIPAAPSRLASAFRMRTLAWCGISQSSRSGRSPACASVSTAELPSTLTASLNTAWPSIRRNGSPSTRRCSPAPRCRGSPPELPSACSCSSGRRVLSTPRARPRPRHRRTARRCCDRSSRGCAKRLRRRSRVRACPPRSAWHRRSPAHRRSRCRRPARRRPRSRVRRGAPGSDRPRSGKIWSGVDVPTMMRSTLPAATPADSSAASAARAPSSAVVTPGSAM